MSDQEYEGCGFKVMSADRIEVVWSNTGDFNPWPNRPLLLEAQLKFVKIGTGELLPSSEEQNDGPSTKI